MYRILLVDDEAQEREGIDFLIKKYHMPLTVSMAANGQKASEYMQAHPVDILFTDVKMPFKDGLALAAETYALNPDIKIIIFSAYGEFDYAKRAMEAHAVDYLLKPIELLEFEKVMEKVIGELDAKKERQNLESERSKTDRKRLLYKAFTGGFLTDGEVRQLDDFFIEMGDTRKLLVSLEADGNLFQEKEEEILTLLQTYFKFSFEYVNLYPDTSVILFYGIQRLNEPDLKMALGKFKRDLAMLYQENLTVVVSKDFKTRKGLQIQSEELNSFLKEVYGKNGRITYISEAVRNSEFYVCEVENLKTSMLAAIDAKDSSSMILYGDQLVGVMEKYHVVSRLYVHHIFYDIIEAFYEKYGIRDRKRIFDKVELLLSNKDNARLLADFREILNEVLTEQSEGLSDSKGVAEAIKAIIEQEYSQDIGLLEIAGRVNLAPAYVSYLFKKETGLNLVKYLTDYRMERAKYLLDESELKMIQVGKACGYENQPYFNRLFKNYFGVTPKQYREQR